MTKALVTGASGFVGRHLVRHLEECGDYVFPVDRSNGGVDMTDSTAVEALLKSVRPEVVYHLAGDSDVGKSWDHPRETFVANAIGTLNVLHASVSAGVARVLTVSSADIYGRVTEDDLPISESSPLRPVSPYAASKVAVDFLALQSYLGHGLAVIRARPFNHIGPGQREDFVAPAIAKRIALAELEGSDCVKVGNLAPRRDFTDVRDVVRAYRLLMEKGEPGEAYNVCSGHDIAIRELAVRLAEMSTKKIRLVSDPALQRPVDIPVLRGDPTKLQDATGWRPLIPLDQTLSEILEEWRWRVRRR
ncbi:MAG: GDP-mannose 4,6-dehydratase [Acidimicrobiales bacterium]|nr:MAG: GDP-mannose 4,6-dehydratase [Acidimicrobiales bacterium]